MLGNTAGGSLFDLACKLAAFTETFKNTPRSYQSYCDGLRSVSCVLGPLS
jgi:hypothetical protein